MIAVYVFIVALLTLAWCILSESFSLATILIGILVGALCMLISRKYLPLSRVRGVSFVRLLLYPLYMLAQIYIAAFSIIKMILTNAKAGIIEVKTVLSNDFLRTLLSHCATLTPGTITLDMDDETIKFLCLTGSGSDLRSADKTIRSMERRLNWAQKRKE